MAIANQRVQFVFHKADRDLTRLAARTNADNVHSYRTTTRRLQTLLEALLPEGKRNQKILLKLVDEIRRRAGKVRDIDVQIAALRSLKTGQQPRRKTQLLQQLMELRAKQEKKLRKLLTKNTIREIRKRLKRSLKQIEPNACREPLVVAREILGRVDAKAAPGEDHLHTFRVLIKRARYAAEFAAKTPDATEFIAELTRLQDTIGAWHDWLTLTHSAAARLGEVSESPLVAALHNVTGGKFRAAIASLKTSSLSAPEQKTTTSIARKPGLQSPATARTDSAA